ncbi:MAG: hypothetical protein ACOYNU_15495, partial [Bacteroidales bacterium]
DMTAYQVYDGQTAWVTAPWTGNAAPQAASADRTTDLKNRADFDGLLYNWKEKGHSLELTGTDTLEGNTLYKIKITRKDGGLEYYFIDNSGFLLQKRIFFRKQGGKEVEVENLYRDYRKVEDIPFAFSVETNFQGQGNEIQVETIELNKPVDNNIFVMPVKK